MTDHLTAMDRKAIEWARTYSLLLLRRAVGLVALWFGLLKVLDASPVADLVAQSLPFLPARTAVLTVGAVEVVIGVGLVTGMAERLTILAFFLLMGGTFSLMVTQPGLGFVHRNPVRLTIMGEFLIKNLVLMAAGITVVATLRKPCEGDGLLRTVAAGVDSSQRVEPDGEHRVDRNAFAAPQSKDEDNQ